MALEDFQNQIPADKDTQSWTNREILGSNSPKPDSNHIQLAGEFNSCPTTPDEWGHAAMDGAVKEGVRTLSETAAQRIHAAVMKAIEADRKKGGQC